MDPTTVGRVVWYFHHLTAEQCRDDTKDKITLIDNDTPCAAHVVYVHNDTLVNLRVTDHNGKEHIKTSVTLTPPLTETGGMEPISRHGVVHRHGTQLAVWMPYQMKSKGATDAVKGDSPGSIKMTMLEDNGVPVAPTGGRPIEGFNSDGGLIGDSEGSQPA